MRVAVPTMLMHTVKSNMNLINVFEAVVEKSKKFHPDTVFRSQKDV